MGLLRGSLAVITKRWNHSLRALKSVVTSPGLNIWDRPWPENSAPCLPISATGPEILLPCDMAPYELGGKALSSALQFNAQHSESEQSISACGIALRQSLVLFRSFLEMQMFQCSCSPWWWCEKRLSRHRGRSMFSQPYFLKHYFAIPSQRKEQYWRHQYRLEILEITMNRVGNSH